MIKILSGYSWLEDELGDDTKEILECLEKGLIKRIYGNEDLEPYFIVLESNIPAVKDILKDDYNKLGEMNIVEYIKYHPFCDSMTLTIQNGYGNEIEITSNDILDDIEENHESYFDDKEQLKIYNAEIPRDEILNALDELGRAQAKIQIESLLDSIKNQKFE
jgi:predicted DNA-binding protein YlxM (UPF0122 family)